MGDLSWPWLLGTGFLLGVFASFIAGLLVLWIEHRRHPKQLGQHDSTRKGTHEEDESST
jgi:fructose-specific phosphotransferase system IIC component